MTLLNCCWACKPALPDRLKVDVRTREDMLKSVHFISLHQSEQLSGCGIVLCGNKTGSAPDRLRFEKTGGVLTDEQWGNNSYCEWCLYKARDISGNKTDDKTQKLW